MRTCETHQLLRPCPKCLLEHKLNRLHDRSNDNRRMVEKSDLVGCFFCGEIYLASEVNEFVDSNTTALCSRCGIDSVLPDVALNEPMTIGILQQLFDRWFGIGYEARMGRQVECLKRDW